MTTLFNTILDFFASLLPNSDGLSVDVENSFTTFFGYVNDFDFVVPVDTLVNVVQAILTFELLLLGYGLTKFIINLVRGSGA